MPEKTLNQLMLEHNKKIADACDKHNKKSEVEYFKKHPKANKKYGAYVIKFGDQVDYFSWNIMERELTINYTNEAIYISSPDSQEKDVIKDMVVLCEGLCTLIHAAHKSGTKKDYESLKSCIKHLEDGFSDETYKIIT